ncbi:MAG: hypothetical protein ACKO96_06500, partial [Flammeovirgaceae bacterium]
MPSDFDKLFESKKELLLGNAELKQSYYYNNKIFSLFYDCELQAVKITNEFSREIVAPERSGYFSSIRLHRKVENQPAL